MTDSPYPLQRTTTSSAINQVARTMKIRDCPHCGRHNLVYTGAYWSCGICGYAITGSALAAEQTAVLRQDRQTER
jgi:ribosomal protein L37AE/L43A